MAVCNIDDLMADAKCFYGLPPNVLAVLAVSLWCDISGGVTPPVTSGEINADTGLGEVNADTGLTEQNTN